MNIRVINLGTVSPVDSQAVYHGLANKISDNDDPILVLVKPSSPYICVGLHQDVHREINQDWCIQNNISIIRRHVGGGCVLLDQNQLFFQFIFPKHKAPNRPYQLYEWLLTPIISCYQQLGLTQVALVGNDVQINGKKICGTGAASIESASVLVGSFLFSFDFALMARSINFPSANFREIFQQMMQRKMVVINDLFDYVPEEDKIIQLLKDNLFKDLNLNPVDSQLSVEELEFIEIAKKEIQDDEWTFQAGNKLIKNGIKIAANTYLLEREYQLNNNACIVRLLLINDCIDKLWIETPDYTEHSKYQNITQQINHSSINKDQCIQRYAAETELVAALKDLLDFTPY